MKQYRLILIVALIGMLSLDGVHAVTEDPRKDRAVDVVRRFLAGLDAEVAPDIFVDTRDIWSSMGRSGEPKLEEVWSLIRKWRHLFCVSGDKPAETNVSISGLVTFKSLVAGKDGRPMVILLVKRSRNYRDEYWEPIFFPMKEQGGEWRIYAGAIAFQAMGAKVFHEYIVLR